MNHSKEKFVAHYKKKYHHENYLPAWMAAEVMSMGTMNRFYQLMDRSITHLSPKNQQISRDMKLSY
jgi:abortive infection bacteriophage resistance protein